MDDDDLMTANHDETDPSPVAPVGESRLGENGLRIFRATTESDILRLIDIALEYHNESRNVHIPFSERKFIRTYSNVIGSPISISVKQ